MSVPSTLPPLDIADLAALDRSAVRVETSSALEGGPIVWRRFGAGPAVVLLHGSAGSWRHWARCIPALARRHTVLVPDLPGMGDSGDMTLPTTLQAIGSLVAGGIRQLLPPGARFDLVGFSFGTAVAAPVALALAERMRTLTLIAPGTLGLPKTTAKLRDWRGAPDREAAREIHRQNLASLMFANAARIDDTAVDIQECNATLARLKTRPITPPDALLPVFDRIDRDIVHAIIGERDVVAASHMDERRRFFASRLPPGHFHIIPGAGHWLAYEAPQALLERLKSILA